MALNGFVTFNVGKTLGGSLANIEDIVRLMEVLLFDLFCGGLGYEQKDASRHSDSGYHFSGLGRCLYPD